MSNMKRWQESSNYENLPIQRGKWWKGNIVKNHTNLTEKCRLSRWGKSFLGKGSDRDLESLYTLMMLRSKRECGGNLSVIQKFAQWTMFTCKCVFSREGLTHTALHFQLWRKIAKNSRTWVNTCFFFMKALGKNMGTKELMCLKGWNLGIRKPNCSYSSSWMDIIKVKLFLYYYLLNTWADQDTAGGGVSRCLLWSTSFSWKGIDAPALG